MCPETETGVCAVVPLVCKWFVLLPCSIRLHVAGESIRYDNAHYMYEYEGISYFYYPAV
jgi:hypothetical protein